MIYRQLVRTENGQILPPLNRTARFFVVSAVVNGVDQAALPAGVGDEPLFRYGGGRWAAAGR
jgi:hypothetical protein